MTNDIQRAVDSGNVIIVDAFMKCKQVLDEHEKALVNISGGADSDVMMDLIERVRKSTPDIEITYCFMDTGLEYAATKRHLLYLEETYGVSIRRERASKSIPSCVKEYGQPFINKFCSDMIWRLQSHGFQWEDEPLDVLLDRYSDCTGALKWWCNAYGRGVKTSLDIGYKRGLKEFMIQNPPWFLISPRCCYYAKKKPKRRVLKEGFDLDVMGLRQSEKGVRSRLNTCFTRGEVDSYRPIYWFDNQTRAQYEQLFQVEHSECYTKYGLIRTGCAGCPFSKNASKDLQQIRDYEPNLVNAIENIFADSYEYTRQFREYVARLDGQMLLNI